MLIASLASINLFFLHLALNMENTFFQTACTDLDNIDRVKNHLRHKGNWTWWWTESGRCARSNDNNSWLVLSFIEIENTGGEPVWGRVVALEVGYDFMLHVMSLRHL